MVGCLGTVRQTQQARLHAVALCNSSTVVVEAPRTQFDGEEHVKDASHVDDVGTRVACRRWAAIQTLVQVFLIFTHLPQQS